MFHRTKASDIGVVDSMAFAKAHMHKFSVPLPDGVDYHFPGGEGAEPVTVSFAAWMVKDGNGGYKALEDQMCIRDRLKERPVREAPYAPVDLYAKWETQES